MRGGSFSQVSTPEAALVGARGRRYRPGLFEPVDEPSFSFEVVLVSGEEGAELRAAQARAIKELLEWLGTRRRVEGPAR